MLWLLCSLFLIIGTCSTQEIKCNLNWLSITSQDPIPVNAISVASDAEPVDFVARFLAPDGSWAGGRVGREKIAYAVVNGQSESSHLFEILTNPFECELRWVTEVNALAVAFDADMYVGRVYSDGSMLSGYVDKSSVLHFIDQNMVVRSSTREKQVLQSSSAGLIASVFDFKMDTDDLQPSTEFLGIDTINNQSPAIVKQSVTHKKKLVQSLQVSESNGKGNFADIFASVKMSVQLDFPGSGGPVIDLARSGPSSGQPISTTEEKEIITERQIEVSPNTAVYVCSTLTVMENFQADYTARAEASAPGLSGAEVESILLENGEIGWELKEGKMVKEIRGTLSGTAALNSQFIVSPTNSKNGCPDISALVIKAKKLKQALRSQASNPECEADLKLMNSKLLEYM